jgi:hypothetical protein
MSATTENVERGRRRLNTRNLSVGVLVAASAAGASALLAAPPAGADWNIACDAGTGPCSATYASEQLHANQAVSTTVHCWGLNNRAYASGGKSAVIDAAYHDFAGGWYGGAHTAYNGNLVQSYFGSEVTNGRGPNSWSPSNYVHGRAWLGGNAGTRYLHAYDEYKNGYGGKCG